MLSSIKFIKKQFSREGIVFFIFRDSYRNNLWYGISKCIRRVFQPLKLRKESSQVRQHFVGGRSFLSQEQAHSTSSYRRSYQRFILDDSVTLVINKNIEEPSILRDLCPRGIGIFSHYPLKENDEVSIIMNVPYLFVTPIHKEAKVVWYKKVDENLWQGGLDFGEDNKIILS